MEDESSEPEPDREPRMGHPRPEPDGLSARLACSASVLLYAASFVLPALADGGRVTSGAGAFALALFGPLFSGTLFLAGGSFWGLPILLLLTPWAANVAYGLALRRVRRGCWREVSWLGWVACALALSPFVTVTAFSLGTSRGLGAVLVFRERYWAWVAATALLAVAGRERGQRGSDVTRLAQEWDD